eukprot:TRINITY_DN5446_c0_g2_i1.p1 TRINITY_DN5446_c0_g2~~TRINITY_DN5446_c0_g2_i1.p1  ORF type:complete len:452 (+),score=131.36 TRINITY_DN5446_c0_g2_i1:314-1669(+)
MRQMQQAQPLSTRYNYLNPNGNTGGLFINSSNKTVISPFLLRKKGEINRQSHLRRDNWVLNMPTLVSAADALPDGSIQEPREEELLAKRRMVAWMKLQRTLAKYKQKIILQERLNAYKHDKKVEYTTLEQKRATTPVERVALKLTEYVPYNLSTDFKYSQEVIGNYKGRLRGKQPLFLHLYNRDTLQVNMNQFIEELSAKLKVEPHELSQALVPRNSYQDLQDMIVVIPKLYVFGEKYLREINAVDYVQSFNYYKLDPIILLSFMQTHLKDKEITLGDLKELLMVIGQPMKLAERRVNKSARRRVAVRMGEGKRVERAESADEYYEERADSERGYEIDAAGEGGGRQRYVIREYHEREGEQEIRKHPYMTRDKDKKHMLNLDKDTKGRKGSNDEVYTTKKYEPTRRVRDKREPREELINSQERPDIPKKECNNERAHELSLIHISEPTRPY